MACLLSFGTLLSLPLSNCAMRSRVDFCLRVPGAEMDGFDLALRGMADVGPDAER